MNKEKLQKQRLINAIKFFNSKIEDMSIMKLDKLLYFFDLTLFKQSGIGGTGLCYYTEQNGPAPKLLNDAILNGNNSYFNDSLSFEALDSKDYTSQLKILSTKDFDNLYFSDDQITVLEEVVAKYGKKSAKELSLITHLPNSPWDLTVKQSGSEMGAAIDFCLALDPSDEITAEYVKDVLGYSVEKIC